MPKEQNQKRSHGIINALLTPSTPYPTARTLSPPNTTNPHASTSALLHPERTPLRRRRGLRTKQRREIQPQEPDHRLRQPGALSERRRTADRSAQVRRGVSRGRRRGRRAERLAFAGEESAGGSGGAFGGVGGGGEDGGAQGGGVGAADGFFDVGAFED